MHLTLELAYWWKIELNPICTVKENRIIKSNDKRCRLRIILKHIHVHKWAYCRHHKKTISNVNRIYWKVHFCIAAQCIRFDRTIRLICCMSTTKMNQMTFHRNKNMHQNTHKNKQCVNVMFLLKLWALFIV